MENKITRSPIKIVMVRRGAITIPGVPTQKLKTFIRKKALLGSDEISGDGKSWVRVDRHYQLRQFFPKEMGDANVPQANQELNEELEFAKAPPDLENNLQEMADLLKDING